MRPVAVELSVLALYSQIGVSEVSGVLDPRIVPQLAAEAMAQHSSNAEEFVPLAILSDSDASADVVDALTHLTRSWHGPEFLSDPFESRWLLSLYWLACIADQRADPLEPIRAIRYLGAGLEAREPGFRRKYPPKLRRFTDIVRAERVWRELELIDYRHDHDGSSYSTTDAAALARTLIDTLATESRTWITASGVRSFPPISDGSWV